MTRSTWCARCWKASATSATIWRYGPVFRKVDRWGNIEHTRLGGDAVRDILRRRAGQAKLTVPAGERLLLLGFAGALRRAELVGLDREHLRFAEAGLRLLLPRSKTDLESKGVELGISRGKRARPARCGRWRPGWRPPPASAAIRDGGGARRPATAGRLLGHHPLGRQRAAPAPHRVRRRWRCGSPARPGRGGPSRSAGRGSAWHWPGRRP
jgi:hypothetical protein